MVVVEEEGEVEGRGKEGARRVFVHSNGELFLASIDGGDWKERINGTMGVERERRMGSQRASSAIHAKNLPPPPPPPAPYFGSV